MLLVKKFVQYRKIDLIEFSSYDNGFPNKMLNSEPLRGK